MPSIKINFPNAEGHQLSGYLQLPADRDPRHFALLAHCFSCTKNSRALREIARALNLAGFGVLRFDMTGLGESEGEFAEAGFASNIADIVAAYGFLAAEHQAPALAIGHSLGGTAMLCASQLLPAVRAMVTIASPSQADHATHLFAESLEEIERRGRATVHLGGRPFDITLDFVRSLGATNVAAAIEASRKALLIMHSPQDTTVDISHAEQIYVKAHHPKSFASLDGADHLLSDPADAHYAGQLIAAWVTRYLPRDPEEDQGQLGEAKAVDVRLGAEGFTTEVMVRHHSLVADEPPSIGGKDYGPNPYELVTAGLGAGTAMTIQMYARRKKWPVEEVDVALRHSKSYAKDLQNASAKTRPTQASGGPAAKVDHFERIITLRGPLNEAQHARLLEIADRCPVHRTLEGKVEITTMLAPES